MTNVVTRRSAAAGSILAVAVSGVIAAAPASAIGDFENSEMMGGGWVTAGDGARAHFQVGLPCPGEDVGFNPQPDPPGHDRARLTIRVGGERYELDEVTGAACTIGDIENREGAIHAGSGLASCGGDRGFVINWRLTDAGVGNPNDSVEVTVRGPGSTAACSNLHVAGPLGGENLQLVPAGAGRE